jgi:DNA-binding transcriptional ArsR family regulator
MRIAMHDVPASVDVFRAVADPTRRAILALLLESDRSVDELRRPFHITQPAISQHLRILRRAGLVRGTRVGRKCLYRIDPRPLEAVYEWAARFREVRDPSGHVWRIAEAGGPRESRPRGSAGKGGRRDGDKGRKA